jgi:putative oxygen-independent coproporphyrinogen III oxidase
LPTTSPINASLSAASLPTLGVYVHWPFCEAICPYCDFNVHLMRKAQGSPADWLEAYRRELAYAQSLRPQGPVETVFFGGGTPSLMSPELVGGILSAIDEMWGLARDAEITLEANPMSAPEAHLTALRAAGVTRLSLGVQAFEDGALKFLGRTHSAQDARVAFAAAQRIFPRASFDLIYARPHQTPEAWAQELSAALALGPQHMSLYQLTIEPETPFYKHQAAGKLTLPDEDSAAQMYELTQSLCASAGLPAYEISNHAAEGHACRHNVASWQGGDYLGIGPGAHGRVTSLERGARLSSVAQHSPAQWLAQVEQDGHGWGELHALDAESVKMEAILLGLRLAEGLSLEALSARGIALAETRLRDLRADGLLTQDPTRLQASARGRVLLDYLTGRLLG